MIERIEVSGFRSLSSFSLDILPGLNILVGPNGAGKTNIIEFFQFLYLLSTNDLSRAISLSGGAGSVFRKTAKAATNSRIDASVKGRTKSVTYKENERSNYIKYCFDFTITASGGFDQIYFSRQRLKMKIDPISPKDDNPSLFSNTYLDIDSDIYDLDIEVSYTEDLVLSVIVYHASEKLLERSLRSIRMRHLLKDVKGLDDIIPFLSDHLTSYITHRGGPTYACLEGMSVVIEDVDSVLGDMIGGEILNIVPWRVKQPEDIATQQGIRKDGSGLAATLYSMQRRDRPIPSRRGMAPYDYRDRGRRVRPVPLGQIESYLQLVNPTISQIKVKNDPYDNRIKLSFIVSSDPAPIELPVAAMSDGTLKWLALITAILTYRSIFAIEEPENFLHPNMQQEILNVMREDANNRGINTFVIMTTHSETLLNAADPKEIVVVSMYKGATIASRPENIDQLRIEIETTGFGLGYYYRTGALDNV